MMRGFTQKLTAVLVLMTLCVALCASALAVDSTDPLEVVIWDNNQQAGLQTICDQFTEQTGIPVQVVVKSWDAYWTLLEAGAMGGDMPDVFWMHSNNAQMYMAYDMLLDLTDYIAASEVVKVENYMPEIWELYTYDAHYYAVPKDYDTIALWYNKTMFDEAGLAYPDATWTYEDLLEAAKALTKADGSQYGFALNPSNDQDTYYNFVYAMGGSIVTEDRKSGYDDPNTIRAMHPEVIVTDELFRGREAEAVCDMVRSGVKVFASLHGRGAESVFRSPIFGRLAEVMEVYIVLSPHPVAGTVTEVLTAEEAAKRA